MNKIKTLLTGLCVIAGTLAAHADLEIKSNSFGSINDNNAAVSDFDLGRTNMTYQYMEDQWINDADGNPTTALLVVFFENMTPAEIAELKIGSLSNNKVASQVAGTKEINGHESRWFFIPESNRTFDINFAHPTLGNVRLTVPQMVRHNIYRVVVRAVGKASVVINTQPAGAAVTFDNKHIAGTTPVTIPDVAFGRHSVAISYPSNSYGKNMPSTTIEVTPAQLTFNYNLVKTKEVKLVANPSNAQLEVQGNGITKQGFGSVTAVFPYGEYTVTGYLSGDRAEEKITIDDSTPAITTINVIPSKRITFEAFQNNQRVNADINIDGIHVGRTFDQANVKPVQYGNHEVSLTYNYYNKSQKIKVGRNTQDVYVIKLPNRLRRKWNPFDTDYNAREWGMYIGYVNRHYKFKEGSSQWSENFWGEEKHEHGMLMGVVWQPYFGYGQGLNTGLYWQMVVGDVPDDDGDYYEHTLAIPLQYQFRLPLAEDFSLFLNAGMQFNFGVYHEVSYGENDSYEYGYGDDFPKAFDCGLLYGGGFQYKAIQLEFKMYRGFTNHNNIYAEYVWDPDDYSVKNRTWSVGLSFLF